MKNQIVGVGNTDSRGYCCKNESVSNGELVQRIFERPGGSPISAQKKINAFNFPFTFNPGAGCFFKCRYCYLRQPFFQRHVSSDHGKEMSFIPNLPAAVEKFLKGKKRLPQYMKRVQAGVSTEMFMPQLAAYTQPDKVLKAFQEHGIDWMLHLVTKSPGILKYKELLAEMKSQVQVEVSFVTLDENASKIFERGTPSVAQRLKIVEELAAAGVFVRMMLMPVMREYELQVVGTAREIVFENKVTGVRSPGRKLVPKVDGNYGKGDSKMEVWNGSRWVGVQPGDTWLPVIKKDWSDIATAHANWRNYGASAYKQKDLNYFYVDELINAEAQDRAPEPERGRSEDPTAEVLINSGETVVDAKGNDVFAPPLKALHLPKKKWAKTKVGTVPTSVPTITRRKMNYGYAIHSKIDWIDCT